MFVSIFNQHAVISVNTAGNILNFTACRRQVYSIDNNIFFLI